MTAVRLIDKTANHILKWHAKKESNTNLIRGLFMPRHDATRASRNLATSPTGARPGAAFGAPVFPTGAGPDGSAGYGSFQAAVNYLISNLPTSQAMTVCAVARATSDTLANNTRPVICGNFGAQQGQAGNIGLLMYFTGGFVRGQFNSATGSTITRVIDVSAIQGDGLSVMAHWNFYAFAFDNTKTQIWNRTNNTLQAQLTYAGGGSGTTRVTNSKSIAIGSDRENSFGGTCDLAWLLFSDSYATLTQIDGWRTDATADLAAYSATVSGF